MIKHRSNQEERKGDEAERNSDGKEAGVKKTLKMKQNGFDNGAQVGEIMRNPGWLRCGLNTFHHKLAVY